MRNVHRHTLTKFDYFNIWKSPPLPPSFLFFLPSDLERWHWERVLVPRVRYPLEHCRRARFDSTYAYPHVSVQVQSRETTYSLSDARNSELMEIFSTCTWAGIVLFNPFYLFYFYFFYSRKFERWDNRKYKQNFLFRKNICIYFAQCRNINNVFRRDLATNNHFELLIIFWIYVIL